MENNSIFGDASNFYFPINIPIVTRDRFSFLSFEGNSHSMTYFDLISFSIEMQILFSASGIMALPQGLLLSLLFPGSLAFLFTLSGLSGQS